MSSPAAQEAAKVNINVAAPASTGESAAPLTPSPASSSKSRVEDATMLLALSNGTNKFHGKASTPVAPTAPMEPVKGQFTPINANIRKSISSPLATAVSPNIDERSIADSTDTDNVASDYAADHANNPSEVDSPASGSIASASSASLNGTRRPRRAPAAKPVNKSLKRVRRRADTGSAAATPAKRVRSTPLMRAAPSATSATNTVTPEFTNFTATIFMVKLGGGANCPQFHVHETVLTKSPRFVREISKARSNKRATKQNVLLMDSFDTIAFEQMISYLYTDKFTLKKDSLTIFLRIREIHEVFSLAAYFELPGLQQMAVKSFSISKMLSKINPATFFDWAEDMYYEELDKENGSFVSYFRRVSPMLLRNCDPDTVKDLCRVASLGGKFCGELFRACYNALDIKPRRAAVVKKEEDVSAEQLQRDNAASYRDGGLFVRG